MYIKTFFVCSGFHCNFLFSWPPKKLNADDYLNSGPTSVILALKPKTSLVFAVEQLAYILEMNIAKSIIKVGLEKCQIIEVLKKTGIAKRVYNLFSKLNFKILMVKFYSKLCIINSCLAGFVVHLS